LLVLLPAACLRGFVFWLQYGQPVFQKYIFLGEQFQQTSLRPFYSSPIYIFWMFLISHLAGLSPDIIRFIQLFTGFISILLVVKITHALFDRSSALAAGILLTFTCPNLVYESDLVTASMVIIVQALALWLIISALNSNKNRCFYWFAAGILTGLSIGIRPNVLLMLPFLAVLLIKLNESWKKNTVRIFIFFTGVTMLIAPITIYNYMQTGDYILVTASGGSVFYSSNNFRATGLGYSPPAALTEIENTWMQKNRTDKPIEHDIFRFLAIRASGMELSHGEISRYYFQEGWRSLGRDPAGSALFWLKKLFYTFNNYEVHDTASLVSASARIQTALPFLLPAGVVLVLGIFALQFIKINDRRIWVLIAFILPHIITGMVFYINGRLRVPILYYFSIFAGVGLIHLLHMVRMKDSSIWMSILFLMGFSMVVGFRDTEIKRHASVETPAFYNSVKGLAALKADQTEQAREFFTAAVKANPLGAREAWLSLADIYKRKGDERKQEYCRQRATGIWSLNQINEMGNDGRFSEYEILMTKARFYWVMEKREKSMSLFRKCLLKYPKYPEPWFNAAIVIAATEKDWKEVISYTNKALARGMKLSLDSERAHRLLVKAYREIQEFDKVDLVETQLKWESSRRFHP